MASTIERDLQLAKLRMKEILKSVNPHPNLLNPPKPKRTVYKAPVKKEKKYSGPRVISYDPNQIFLRKDPKYPALLMSSRNYSLQKSKSAKNVEKSAFKKDAFDALCSKKDKKINASTSAAKRGEEYSSLVHKGGNCFHPVDNDHPGASNTDIVPECSYQKRAINVEKNESSSCFGCEMKLRKSSKINSHAKKNAVKRKLAPNKTNKNCVEISPRISKKFCKFAKFQDSENGEPSHPNNTSFDYLGNETLSNGKDDNTAESIVNLSDYFNTKHRCSTQWNDTSGSTCIDKDDTSNQGSTVFSDQSDEGQQLTSYPFEIAVNPQNGPAISEQDTSQLGEDGKEFIRLCAIRYLYSQATNVLPPGEIEDNGLPLPTSDANSPLRVIVKFKNPFTLP
ncbi:hypothetical protein JTE90_018461 [Oedothorax gibbosus]|uniref:Uncharacterized protein n=1 Tax=Oedothorax gibbosus TaxID=931172 RepID=A0AAV6V091_9ARAC|nr:hypothetical protein JTE90_018461 [Oedothorax gibbosus]